MRLLVVGGTSFVGRAVVTEALRRGHRVTTFNRGRTGPDLPGVEAVRGDRSRHDGLAQLNGRSFDAALDPGGLIPAHVLRTVRLLARTVPFYGYVSSVSAYRDWERVPAHEDAPLHAGFADEDGDPADLSAYGRRKAGCERAVREAYDASTSLIVRPGVIVGPFDNVGHLPWWLHRIARGGPVLAPGDPDRPVQLLDVRDLAVFLLDRTEAGLGGTFNAVPDARTATMGDWLHGCAAATGSRARLVWVSESVLRAWGVQEWDELPLWVADTPEHRAAWAVPGDAAAAAGLRCRPSEQTIHDTWAWLRAGGSVRQMAGLPPIGLDPMKERRILAAWQSSCSAHSP